MGKYINSNSKGEALPANKAVGLLADGATLLPDGAPETFCENLVCVVDNGPFTAAAYVYSERELQAFNSPDDWRAKVWLQYEHAAKLAR